MNSTLFETIHLNNIHPIYYSRPIEKFLLTKVAFQTIWQLHPQNFHQLKIHVRIVPTSRWQQAYGKNYRYTGSQNNALPIPSALKPFIDWSKENIDDRLNGLFLNWYDGQLGHYIGPHRDDTRDLILGSPIVTISLGQERKFRMRPYQQNGYKDLIIRHGEVIVMPWKTNLNWTHEVPKSRKYTGKRISITLRVFK